MIANQFGVSFKIMLPRSLAKIKFSANEASFVHLEAQVKCYSKREHIKCSCVAEWLRAVQK